MPLRGLLFKKLIASKNERKKIELGELKRRFQKDAKALTKLRGQRIQRSAANFLKDEINKERAKIRSLKGPSKLSRLEWLAFGAGKKGAKAARGKTSRKLGKLALRELGLISPRKRRKRKKR